MALPAALEPLVASWSSYYGDHQLVSVAVRYVHLASVVLGGGTALALDRRVVRAANATGDTRRALLLELRGSHRVVVPSLVVLVITGALMSLADLDTFLGSNLYWTKLAFVTLLVANGGFLVSAESAAERAGGDAWGRLKAAAAVSLCLWLATLFVGTWLTVGA